MANARRGDLSGFRQAGLQDFGVSEGKSNLFSMSPHVHYAGSGSAMPGLSNTPFNDKLSYMAGNLEPRINNTLDTNNLFRPAREIVRDVNSLEGNKQPNSLLVKICSPSLSFTAETNINMANAREPQKGDLIEFPRTGFQHWGVSDGKGNVIHLSPDVPHEGSGSVMAVLADTATVKKDKLSDVAGNVEPRINNCLDTKYEPRPTDDIMRDAEQLVDTKQPYSLRGENCEHLVNKLRYGEAESQQVQQVVDTTKGVAGMVGAVGVAGVTLGPVGAVAVFWPSDAN